MTAREIKITLALLNYLHGLDGGQASELQIHAHAFAAFDGPKPGAAELSAALANADTRRWVTKVVNKLNERLVKYNITDAGESVRLDLLNE